MILQAREDVGEPSLRVDVIELGRLDQGVDGGGTSAALSNQQQHKYRIASQQPLTPGKHTIRFEFTYDGGGIGRGGTGRLLVDGVPVAQGHIERTVQARFSLDETFDVGANTGTPVVEDYASKMPFKFTGTLAKLTIELKPVATNMRGELERLQRETEFRKAMRD